jgi:dimethylglycine dehydrogenase
MLSPMLNQNGRLIGDFTIAKAGDEQFFMWGSSQAQVYHMRWFERHLPTDGSVTMRPLGMDLVGLSIAGPKARGVLTRLTDEDVSAEAFRFLDFRRMDLAAVPAMVNRVTYTGDLGYEIWVRPEYQRRLYAKIMEAGADLGIANFGMRALLSLRLEKNWPTWFRELRPIYGPFEADVGRFVDLKKNDFIGREQAAEEQASGGKLKRVTFVVDAKDADVLGDEPIWHAGKVVGWVTSGGYAHYVDRSLAQGYVPKELAADGAAFEIEIIGERRPATIQHTPLFDPEGARMRG